MPVELWEPQMTACQRIYRGFLDYNSVLCVMPTGSGKSYVMGACAEAWGGAGWGGRDLGDRVLCVTNRDELVWQLVRSLTKVTGETPEVEKGELKSENNAMFDRSRFVVASIQTLSREYRRERFDPSEFGLVILDEAHHAVAPSYIETLDYFAHGGAKVLGLTATPDRSDEVSLGKVFDAVAYEYGLIDAIQDKYLCPVKQMLVEVEGLSYKGLRGGADLSAADVERVISREDMLHRMAAPLMQHSGDRPTIVFTPGQQTSDDLAKIINRYRPGSAASVHGKTDDDVRAQSVKDYQDGKIQYLVNCSLFLEGFDAPRTACIAMFRPTMSRALYAQMSGRGLRIHPGKDDCLLLDFCGNSRHKLITGIDLLGGNYGDVVLDEVLGDALRAGANGLSIDVLEAIKEAAAIEDELRSRQRAEILAKAKTKSKMIDPFDVLDVPDRVMPGYYETRMPTEKMINYLDSLGVPTGGLSYWRAKRLCDVVHKRREEGLCTFKQARQLGAWGHPTSLSFEQATATLDRLFAKNETGKPWVNFTGGDWKKFHEAKRRKKEREAQGDRA